jgi:hypothetical protein
MEIQSCYDSCAMMINYINIFLNNLYYIERSGGCEQIYRMRRSLLPQFQHLQELLAGSMSC